MRIEDDERRLALQNRVDDIRRLQEQQEILHQEQAAPQVEANQQPAGEVEDQTRAAQLNGQAGVERAAEAVDTAHRQQEAGEGWQRFSNAQESEPLPLSVEDAAREQDRKGQADQGEEQRISARDLQNQMAVRQRMIRS